jgi:hypothetical protein
MQKARIVLKAGARHSVPNVKGNVNLSLYNHPATKLSSLNSYCLILPGQSCYNHLIPVVCNLWRPDQEHYSIVLISYICWALYRYDNRMEQLVHWYSISTRHPRATTFFTPQLRSQAFECPGIEKFSSTHWPTPLRGEMRHDCHTHPPDDLQQTSTWILGTKLISNVDYV